MAVAVDNEIQKKGKKRKKLRAVSQGAYKKTGAQGMRAQAGLREFMRSYRNARESTYDQFETVMLLHRIKVECHGIK